MYEFSNAVLLARKKAGLSQTDCAHLLEITPARFSRLENGKAAPSMKELCGIAVLFGRTMEGLSGDVFTERARTLKERLNDLPEPRRHRLSRFNRAFSLEALSDRLDQLIGVYGR